MAAVFDERSDCPRLNWGSYERLETDRDGTKGRNDRRTEKRSEPRNNAQHGVGRGAMVRALVRGAWHQGDLLGLFDATNTLAADRVTAGSSSTRRDNGNN